MSVARAADLPGATTLDISSDSPIAGAWDMCAMHTGVSSDDLAARVATHYRLEVAELAGTDPQAWKLIPARVARKLQVVPLAYSDRSLTVATSEPVSMEAEREISHVSGRNVHFHIAPPEALAAAVSETYPDQGELRHELPPLSLEAKGGPRVLVVDDDPDTRLLLRTALDDHGFRVTEAPDGPEALELLKEGDPFALVTLDLQMEKMHGLEVLKSIRSNTTTAIIPVVVATASDDPVVELQLFEAGADDFIVKPVDPPRFLLRVQAVLRRRTSGSFGGLF